MAESVIKSVVTPVVVMVAKSAESTVPANVLRNEDGTPIRNEDGSYIYTN